MMKVDILFLILLICVTSAYSIDTVQASRVQEIERELETLVGKSDVLNPEDVDEDLTMRGDETPDVETDETARTILENPVEDAEEPQEVVPDLRETAADDTKIDPVDFSKWLAGVEDRSLDETNDDLTGRSVVEEEELLEGASENDVNSRALNKSRSAGTLSRCKYCGRGWVSRTFHYRRQRRSYCFFFSKDARNWYSAQQRCKSMRGKLVEFPEWYNINKIYYVRNMVRARRQPYWIGATDMYHEGDFIYPITGSSVFANFADWATKTLEPNNLRNREDCVTVARHLDYRWNDENCSKRFRYVCEKLC